MAPVSFIKPQQGSSISQGATLSILTTYENLTVDQNFDLILDVVLDFLHNSNSGMYRQFKPREVAKWFLEEYDLHSSFYTNETGLAIKFDRVIKDSMRTISMRKVEKRQHFEVVNRTATGNLYVLREDSFWRP
jgi:hypothetical protein